MAKGLGETLASANQQGTPWRFTFHKKTKEVSVLSYANYSNELVSDLSTCKK
jgi:hypothetical protein